MKKEKLKPMDLRQLAEEWGLNYEVLLIKKKLVDDIKHIAKERNISQRKLATMVDGLTQDRVSKIFSGHIGHMTIDKLVEILSALKVRVKIQTSENTAA